MRLRLKRLWRQKIARGLVLLALLALFWYGLPLFTAKPQLYAHYAQSQAVFAAGGQLLALRPAMDERYRLRLALTDMTPALQQATLLYEDRRFYQHFGLDLPALARAFWQGVVKGGRRQGASTITMQLARLHYGIDSQTVLGKLQQIGLALYLERHFSKDAILEAYLNYAPYGGNIESVAAASLIYFGKTAAELSTAEALALAVIPQNPLQRNPERQNGAAQLEAARARLLQIWQQYYPLTASEQQLLQIPLRFKRRSDLPFTAPHFVQALAVQQPNGQLHSSLDWHLQQQVQQRVDSYLRQQQRLGLRNASVLVVHRPTMQIKAYIGSADFYNREIAGQVDGTAALRSPGSALKPFIYALALQQGHIHPKSLLKDLPQRFGLFSPENFDRRFQGPLTATAALVQSRNVPAVTLQAKLAQPDFYQWLGANGVRLPQDANYYGLALALGGLELSMQQMVRLYAMLGNQGQYRDLQWLASEATTKVAMTQPVSIETKPWTVTAIPPQDVVEITSHELKKRVAAENNAGLLPEAAFLTLQMLSSQPALQNARLAALTDSPPVAWKTGTSYAYRDAWTLGLYGDYVVAVWLGNFDGSSNPNLVGRTVAAPLFFSLLPLLGEQQHANQQLFAVSEKLNLRQVALCRQSFQLPNRFCPATELGWVIPGVSPIALSELHRPVPIFRASGLRACYHQPPLTELQVFEFWPSDIAALYQQAGVRLQQPPAYASPCSQLTQSQAKPPQILSPQAGLTYFAQAGRPLALQVRLDGAATQSYWFAGKRFLGAVGANETLFWSASAGEYQLRVQDDLGGSSEITLNVQ
ncbi:MAG: penicillin-binding protein 1C [Alishewanella sp.]|nr:penicillin-binding protein 1C [Alishewanella sp.]